MSTAIIIIAIIIICAIIYFFLGTGTNSNNFENAETEAKRFAKLLIAEIKLYEDYRVQKGLKNNNLYELLEVKIEDAREMYKKKFASSEFEQYFEDTLIEILANGDKNKLGLEYDQRSQ